MMIVCASILLLWVAPAASQCTADCDARSLLPKIPDRSPSSVVNVQPYYCNASDVTAMLAAVIGWIGVCLHETKPTPCHRMHSPCCALPMRFWEVLRPTAPSRPWRSALRP